MACRAPVNKSYKFSLKMETNPVPNTLFFFCYLLYLILLLVLKYQKTGKVKEHGENLRETYQLPCQSLACVGVDTLSGNETTAHRVPCFSPMSVIYQTVENQDPDSPCGICGKKSGIRTGSSPNTSVFSPSIPQRSYIILGHESVVQ